MPRQIGWSQESNLLYNISMQLDRLAAVTAAAGGGGGGTITGGGAAGQITFWDAATNITGSNNLFWDNVNKRMGIGTNTPLTTAAGYTVLALNNITGGVLEFQSNGTRIATINNNSLQLDIETKIAGPITFGTNGSEKARIAADGKFGIGTNAPAYTLDVSGTTRFSGDSLISTAASNYSLSIVNSVSSVPLYINSSGSATGGLEIANQNLRRLRILVTATNTTFESSNQTGGFIFGAAVTVPDFTSTGALVKLGSVSSTVYFVDGYNNNFRANALYFYNATTNIRGLNAGGQGLIVSKSSGLTDLYPSSIFAIDSTTQGFLPPRMTTTQRNAIATPAAGLTIFNSTNGDLEVYDGNTWEGLTIPTNRQTVNYSLVLADKSKLVEMNVGAANTLTVPPNSSIAFPIGTKIDIAQYGAGQTSIVPGVGVTVRSALGALKLAAQYSGASLVKIGTDEWYLFGDITV